MWVLGSAQLSAPRTSGAITPRILLPTQPVVWPSWHAGQWQSLLARLWLFHLHCNRLLVFFPTVRYEGSPDRWQAQQHSFAYMIPTPSMLPCPGKDVSRCQKANVVFWSWVHLFDFRGKTCVLSPSVVLQRLDPKRWYYGWRVGDTWPIGHKELEPIEPPRIFDPIDPMEMLIHGMKAFWRMVNRAGESLVEPRV